MLSKTILRQVWDRDRKRAQIVLQKFHVVCHGDNEILILKECHIMFVLIKQPGSGAIHLLKQRSLITWLTQWSWVTSDILVSIGLGNRLSPFSRQVITWTNGDRFKIMHSGINLNEIGIKTQQFSLKRRILRYRLQNVGNYVSASML